MSRPSTDSPHRSVKREGGNLALSPGWRSALACPGCHAPLSVSPVNRDALRCTSCAKTFACPGGIGEFTDLSEFYEREGFVSSGSDFSATPVGKTKLYFARHHYLYDIARYVPRGSRVIEIGCGGGSRYLAANYEMLGIDLSTSSTRQAATVYSSVIRADCVNLPLADGSVDAVVSSFILEHFEGEAFDRFFVEMARILKPGGRMVHYFDLENDAPFTEWAKTKDWYQALFVDERGHHCLRFLPQWEEAFARGGFRTINRRFSCKTWLQDLSIWSRLADGRVSGWAGRFGRFIRNINTRFGRPADVAMCLYQDAVERFQPNSWASKVIWVLEKKA